MKNFMMLHELGLMGTDASYRVLEFLDFRINNLNAGVDSHIFGNMEFKEFSESIDPEMIGQDFYDSWFSLFKFDNRLQYLWTGTNEDIKNDRHYRVFENSYILRNYLHMNLRSLLCLLNNIRFLCAKRDYLI